VSGIGRVLRVAAGATLEAGRSLRVPGIGTVQKLAILLAASAASAQTLTDVAHMPAAIRDIDPAAPHSPLPCTVKSIEPTLNFGLQLQTGYILRVPVKLYSGAGHHWYVLLRVTPAGAKPVYLTDSIDLPDISQPDSSADAEVRGLFLVGEGLYQVSFSMLDDSGRVCRESWNLDAAPNGGNRPEAMLPPNAVADFSSLHAQPTGSPQPHLERLTILLDAAWMMTPRMVSWLRPEPADSYINRWETLLSMLAAVMQQVPANSVRLVVFDLTQQREVLRKDGFTLRDMGGVVRLGDARQQWPVNYRVLQNPSGAWDLVSDLANREARAQPPSGAVVFIGIPMRSPGKLPSEMPGPAPDRRFFYVEYRTSRPEIFGAYWPPADPRTTAIRRNWTGPTQIDPVGPTPRPFDSVEDCVRHFKGSIFPVASPADFEKALKKIETDLGK